MGQLGLAYTTPEDDDDDDIIMMIDQSSLLLSRSHYEDIHTLLLMTSF